MELLDWDIRGGSADIELVAMGMNWDLHAWATLARIAYSPPRNALVLRWEVPAEVPNGTPWGDEHNHSRACEVQFEEVRDLRIRFSPGVDWPEDRGTTRRITKVIARAAGEEETPVEQRVWSGRGPRGAFAILVELDGGTIEVDAARARFVAEA